MHQWSGNLVGCLKRRICFFVLIISAGVLSPIHAHAYKAAYHFYLTYALGYLCGLPDTNLIAWAVRYVDIDPRSSPGVRGTEIFRLSKIGDRKIFHFPIDDASDEVAPESAPARSILDAALKAEEIDPVWFGIGLHPFQDSWPHEGYGPVFGHAIRGTKPDYPGDDVPRALRMAEATWRMLNLWSERTTGSPCQLEWSLAEGVVKTLTGPRFSDTTSLAKHLRSQMEILIGMDVAANALDDSTHVDHFLDLIARIKNERSR